MLYAVVLVLLIYLVFVAFEFLGRLRKGEPKNAFSLSRDLAEHGSWPVVGGALHGVARVENNEYWIHDTHGEVTADVYIPFDCAGCDEITVELPFPAKAGQELRVEVNGSVSHRPVSSNALHVPVAPGARVHIEGVCALS